MSGNVKEEQKRIVGGLKDVTVKEMTQTRQMAAHNRVMVP